MQFLSKAAIVGALIAVPVVAFAGSGEQLSRAQVKGELVQLEKAGYAPNVIDLQYPRNLERAEATVAAQNNGDTSYGSPLNSSMQSGK
ncbi:DUF4148 domain-containing protein [Burkholderia pseudomallei]|nr:DUF4148 domain-containing protein [Burkholderia pseudomallei]